MKVIYRANKNSGRCPYLTDGKVYEVEDIVEIDNEGTFYAVLDDDEDEDWKDEPIPYPAMLFEVVEGEKTEAA